MGNGPKIVADNTAKIIEGWKTVAPTATFAGMTLAQFQIKVQPSVDARNTLADLRTQITATEAARDKADVVTNPQNQIVVNAIKGDPNYGEDSDLYAAIGYVRKSARKSGLTHKAKAAGASAVKK
jgi:hypothetical protein